jgi:DNA-binding transcriptional regulator GbsR (MarR family)
MVSKRTKKKSPKTASKKGDVEIFDSASRDEIKKNIHKELDSLKKIKEKTEKMAKNLTKKAKKKLNEVDVQKLKEPAIYIAVGAVAGVLLSKIFGGKK